MFSSELPIAAQQYQPYQPSTVLVHARWSWHMLVSLKITLPSLVERDYICRTQAFVTRGKKDIKERGEGKKKETLRFWILFITDKLCKTIMAYQIMKVTGNTSFNHKGTSPFLSEEVPCCTDSCLSTVRSISSRRKYGLPISWKILAHIRSLPWNKTVYCTKKNLRSCNWNSFCLVICVDLPYLRRSVYIFITYLLKHTSGSWFVTCIHYFHCATWRMKVCIEQIWSTTKKNTVHSKLSTLVP